MHLKGSFHPCAAITIVFWSLAYVFTRIALEYFSPFSLGLLRYAVSSVVLIFVAVSTKMKLLQLKDIPLFIVSGASGFFLYMIAFNTGSQTVTTATSSVIIATATIITALLARVVFKEKLSAVQYAATAVSFSGVVVLTVLSGGLSVNRGLIYLLCAAVFAERVQPCSEKTDKGIFGSAGDLVFDLFRYDNAVRFCKRRGNGSDRGLRLKC